MLFACNFAQEKKKIVRNISSSVDHVAEFPQFLLLLWKPSNSENKLQEENKNTANSIMKMLHEIPADLLFFSTFVCSTLH